MKENEEDVWLKLSERERLILTIAPKPMSLISTIVSLWIGISIIRDKKKMSKMYHRLALGLCISSAVNSFFYFVSSWAIPAGTDGSIGAIGTDFTCSLAGFFHSLGIIVTYYYVSLSFYVYVALKCEFRIHEIEWMEKYIHLGVSVFPLSTSIFLAIDKHYRSVGFGCWLSEQYEVLLFGIFPILSNFILAGGFILLSYRGEQKKSTFERNARRLSGKQVILEYARQQKARLVAKQGAIYLAVFVFSYTFVLVAAAVNTIQTSHFNFPTLFLALVFHPSDGLFFTIAYVSLLGRREDLTIEIVDTDKVHKLTYSVRKDTQRDILDRAEGQRYEQTCLRPYSVSLFDGLDEDKWKAYGVYVGSDSDSSFDNECPEPFCNEKEDEKTVNSNSTPSTNLEVKCSHQKKDEIILNCDV